MKQNIDIPALGYDPQSLPRELKRHYISASETDVKAMLEAIDTPSIEGLFDNPPLKTSVLRQHLIFLKNSPTTSFSATLPNSLRKIEQRPAF